MTKEEKWLHSAYELGLALDEKTANAIRSQVSLMIMARKTAIHYEILQVSRTSANGETYTPDDRVANFVKDTETEIQCLLGSLRFQDYACTSLTIDRWNTQLMEAIQSYPCFKGIDLTGLIS